MIGIEDYFKSQIYKAEPLNDDDILEIFFLYKEGRFTLHDVDSGNLESDYHDYFGDVPRVGDKLLYFLTEDYERSPVTELRLETILERNLHWLDLSFSRMISDVPCFIRRA